ncbi:GNAT family N-acetyltransferase [Sphingomonas ginsenosidivorax]|uniref:GNAT family N-acetyltransferase n=1 Tax=Sphingomonas ginsenosidivorax TaxID=862135 RepID=A0A5C6UKW0_9SPHN|nr:GNAT family N-acetyltransferase [Sphingomonas ginsenosidivorax]TXC72118.1 GNAT family N-acetyltransferase [Sphingomonas ginsenosidivorax]
MAEIEIWLDTEEALFQAADAVWRADGYMGERPPRGFRCNWDTTVRRWRDEETRVDVLMVDGEAVGFLDGHHILEVRPDLRKTGHGRLLAEFMVDLAFAEGWSVVEIEIAPSAAEPFWRRMGFTTIPERTGSGGGMYAYRILPRSFHLSNGERVRFTIEFFTAQGRFEQDPKPFSRFSGSAERLPDGSLQLLERIICFEPELAGHTDYFVRIELDGRQIHFDKIKYDTSRLHGIRFDAGYTWFIDRITPLI